MLPDCAKRLVERIHKELDSFEEDDLESLYDLGVTLYGSADATVEAVGQAANELLEK